MSEKILSQEKLKINYAVSISLAVAVAVFAPLIGNQIITGTIVNATLFVSTAILGLKAGLLVGFFPSIIALSFGLLPIVLMPMIPFIILSNFLLVSIFSFLKNRSYWAGVFSASLIKFIFLSVSFSFIGKLIINESVAQNVALMMSWPQLITALMGGFLAFILIYKRDRN